ncbi:MAG TPA: carboxylesterase family protein [Caulobacteraceae bacterium]
MKLAIVTALAAASNAGAAVNVDGGRLQGAREGGLAVYKGVPFAASPVGELRWREPQPVKPWKGVRPARAFAPACMQSGVSMPGEAPPRVSEDCLYLNIWAPAKARVAPVMVFFPGGGLVNGNASAPIYWGDRLASRGAVVITVGYRLGPLGFLALPELAAESPHASSGDYGLLDQVAALRWVKRNAAAFGGDARRVTIFGQSSGSMSVSLLMASPLARGLFQRAIGESGGVFEPISLAPNYSLAGAERQGAAYAASLGATSLKALRALPAERFVGPGANAIAHPVVEPYFLPQPPYETFRAGRQNDVPLLVGWNAEEARSLIGPEPIKAASFAADIGRAFGPLPAPLMAAYPHATDSEARQGRLDFERDLRFGWDMWAWARLQTATGTAPVHVYYLTRRPPFPAGSLQADWGAGHFVDLWYVFGHGDQAPWRWSAVDQRLADAVEGYWTAFAATGDPNAPGRPAWPAFRDAAEGPVLDIGDRITVGAVPNLATMKVFDAVYGAWRGGPAK